MKVVEVIVALLLVQALSWAEDPTPAPLGEGGVVVTVHGMLKRESVSGEVPLLDTSVRIKSVGLGERASVTDGAGGFDLYKVKPGEYELSVDLSDSTYVYNVKIEGEQPITILSPIVLKEWVYYGNKAHPGDSSWTELLFKKVTGDSQSLPNTGDIVIPTEAVTIRQGPIFRRGKDLLLEKPTGKDVKVGQKLKVLEVREPFPGSPPDLADGSVWIRFLTVTVSK
jgi:hypothetical protein